LTRIAKYVIMAAKEDVFNKEDARTVMAISQELDTTNPALLKGMQRRLKEIYIRNFRTLRDAEASKKNKQSEEAKEPTKKATTSLAKKAKTMVPRVPRRPLRVIA
jgi:hypothetical protein